MGFCNPEEFTGEVPGPLKFVVIAAHLGTSPWAELLEDTVLLGSDGCVCWGRLATICTQCLFSARHVHCIIYLSGQL